MDYCTKPSGQKHEFLFCENFKYHFKTQKKDGSRYWVCRNIGCNASVSTKEGRIIKVSGARINEHTELQLYHHPTCKPLTENEIKIVQP